MTTKKILSQIERKLPSGAKLPVGFKAFLSAGVPVRVTWSSLKHHGFLKSAEKELVPFIHVADGALVALWYAVAPPAVVMIDAHGEPPTIIATDFPNFLKAISASKTGVPDIDIDCAEITIPRYASKPKKAGTAALQRKLTKWASEHNSLLEPDDSLVAEKLRKTIHSIAYQMIDDGCLKVYSKDSHWWSMDFRIQRKRNALAIQYLTRGKWYDVPAKYKLTAHVAELLSMVKNPKLRKFELCITHCGIVSVDNDKQIVLLP